MNEQFSRFLRCLHFDFLKEQGFKKQKGNFRFEQEGKIVLIQFQSSSWNTSKTPPTFYINVGLGFTEFGRFGKGFMSEAIAFGRINNIVLDAPPEFSLTLENYSELKQKILKLLSKMLETIDCYWKPVYKIGKKGNTQFISMVME